MSLSANGGHCDQFTTFKENIAHREITYTT